MSGGYRVQSTNLVVFKEVPMNLRVSFFDNYALIVSTREGIGNIHKEYGAILKNVIPSKSKLTREKNTVVVVVIIFSKSTRLLMAN